MKYDEMGQGGLHEKSDELKQQVSLTAVINLCY